MLNFLPGDSMASPSIDLRDNRSKGWAARSPIDDLPSTHEKIFKPEEKLVNPWRNVTTQLTRSTAKSSLLADHAAPLSPMRDRDVTELSDLFDRDDMHDLEQDVNHHLIRLFPEPCWEENGLAFLQEHL